MTSKAKRTFETDIGLDVFKYLFGADTFIKCLIELIKNSIDAGATKINLITADRSRFSIYDDGIGMGDKEGNSFNSLAKSLADVHKMQQFGLGAKMMSFSHAVNTEVVSAPQEFPSVVRHFSWTTEEYTQKALNRVGTSYTEETKTPTSWPYPSDFGTLITYTLAKPNSEDIVRGEKLAHALSQRLPRDFSAFLSVDGVLIPQKAIIGKEFREVVNIPRCGLVTMCIYRPKRRTSKKDKDDVRESFGEESLRMTPHRIGEAPYSHFALLCNNLPIRLPEMLLRSGIAGIIQVDWLRDYSTERRDTLRPDIADDPRTLILIKVLNKYAAEIEQCLELTPTENESGTIFDVMDGLQKIYNKTFDDGTTVLTPQKKVRTPPPDDDDTTPRDSNPITLSIERYEFGIGEVIEVTASIRKDMRTELNLGMLRWHTDRSGSTQVTKTEKGIRCIAATAGPALIKVDVPNRPYGQTTLFEIVERRRFGIRPDIQTLVEGTSFRITADNVDTLKGELEWSVDGPGEIEPRKNSAIFHATRFGRAVVMGRDSKNPHVKDECEVTITPLRLIHIEDECFQLDPNPSGSDEPPINIISMGKGNIHRLHLNNQSSSWKKAESCHQLLPFLIHEIMHQYVHFKRFELESQSNHTFTALEAKLRSSEQMRDARAIYEQLLDQLQKS